MAIQLRSALMRHLDDLRHEPTEKQFARSSTITR